MIGGFKKSNNILQHISATLFIYRYAFFLRTSQTFLGPENVPCPSLALILQPTHLLTVNFGHKIDFAICFK